MFEELKAAVNNANHVLVLQADNPDGDSLGSALALEAIFSEMGKTVTMSCAVDIAAHLKHMAGWDRVQKELPGDFDISIVVDTSSENLFELYEKNPNFSFVKAKPMYVIDHHAETGGLSYATVTHNLTSVATGEAIYEIASELDWPLPLDACEFMAMAIMSDSLGLTTDSTTPKSIRTIADLVEKGVSLAKLETARRELMRKEPILLGYKGELLQRVDIDHSGRIANVRISWNEIEKYSPLYNPSMLVIDDMRLTIGVDLAIAYKIYKDGKITAKIRCNYGKPIGGDLAAHFGGGGHPYASGFKIMKKRPIDDVHSEVLQKANELLDALSEDE